MTALKYLLTLLFVGVVIAEPQWYNSRDGRRYLIDAEQKYNWLSAQQACSRRNLQLVEIKSAAKNEALVEVLSSTFKRPINLWLGANDEFNTNQDPKRPFYWSSSGKRMDFTNWSEGSPANAGSNEHCVHICAKTQNYEWSDLPCTEQIGLICEEQPSYNTHRASLQEKGQKVLDITKKLFGSQQHEQKKSMEKFMHLISQVVKKNNEISRYLEKIESNMSHSNDHSVQLRNKELRSYVEAALKTVQELDQEMQDAAHQMYTKFSKDFNDVQKTIEYIMGNKNEQ
ncbi:lectin subunit alpha-like [Musca vetustissima]|uniref:lectin subunit alpha-like n=1 Tax=Musca vetustissima TaxID=27455 RepID=UPI002AB7B68A|nr:lectin subunit alpha-like [Musca vetustissima]